MKKGEQAAQEQTVGDVARSTRRKAAFLARKPLLDQREVYALAKDFFKAYLKRQYEFTMDELHTELHKVYLSSTVRERVDALIEKLGLLEYTDTQYSQAELKGLVQDLAAIVRDLVVEHKKYVPWLTRFANWLFRKKLVGTETVISDFPALESQEPAYVELNTVLEDIYKALERNQARKATKYYKYLIRRYDSLGASVQHQFYHKVQEAYQAILRSQG